MDALKNVLTLSGITLALVSCVGALICIHGGCTGDMHIRRALRDQKVPRVSFAARLDIKLIFKKVILKLLKICWRPFERKLGSQPRGFVSPGWFLLFIRLWSYSLALCILPLFIKTGQAWNVFLPQYLLPECLFMYICKRKVYYLYHLSLFPTCVRKASTAHLVPWGCLEAGSLLCPAAVASAGSTAASLLQHTAVPLQGFGERLRKSVVGEKSRRDEDKDCCETVFD